MKSHDIIPKKFEFSYGAALDLLSMPNFKLKNGKFVEEIPFYVDSPTPLEIKPTKEQWVEFWKKMDEIDIWNWNRDYYALCLDGVKWKIKIVQGDRKIESYGSNAYPDLNPKHSTDYLSPTFKKFVNAFKDLTGINILEEEKRRRHI